MRPREARGPSAKHDLLTIHTPYGLFTPSTGMRRERRQNASAKGSRARTFIFLTVVSTLSGSRSPGKGGGSPAASASLSPEGPDGPRVRKEAASMRVCAATAGLKGGGDGAADGVGGTGTSFCESEPDGAAAPESEGDDGASTSVQESDFEPR